MRAVSYTHLDVYKRQGLGYALAKRRVTNEELSTFVDTNDEWISSRTGIRARYISEEENTSDLGARAARMAIDKSGIDPKEIDLIITCLLYTSMSCVLSKP